MRRAKSLVNIIHQYQRGTSEFYTRNSSVLHAPSFGFECMHDMAYPTSGYDATAASAARASVREMIDSDSDDAVEGGERGAESADIHGRRLSRPQANRSVLSSPSASPDTSIPAWRGRAALADRELVVWLNSLPFPSALLCNGVADLRSGVILFDCMIAFLRDAAAAAPTTRSSHPGPPAQRIAETLDELISFFSRQPEIAELDSGRSMLSHLRAARQALLHHLSGPLTENWVDDLLMWMVGVFRYIANAGTSHQTSTSCAKQITYSLLPLAGDFPDPERLAEAALAAEKSCLTLQFLEKENIERIRIGSRSRSRSPPTDLQGRSTETERPQVPLTGPLPVAAPKPTPPLRSLPAENSRQASAAERGLGVRSGAGASRSPCKRRMERGRVVQPADATELSREITRAPSPLHSGRCVRTFPYLSVLVSVCTYGMYVSVFVCAHARTVTNKNTGPQLYP